MSTFPLQKIIQPLHSRIIAQLCLGLVTIKRPLQISNVTTPQISGMSRVSRIVCPSFNHQLTKDSVFFKFGQTAKPSACPPTITPAQDPTKHWFMKSHHWPPCFSNVHIPVLKTKTSRTHFVSYFCLCFGRKVLGFCSVYIGIGQCWMSTAESLQ